MKICQKCGKSAIRCHCPEPNFRPYKTKISAPPEIRSCEWVDALGVAICALKIAMRGATESKEDFSVDEMGQHLKALEWLHSHKRSASTEKLTCSGPSVGASPPK